MYKRFVVVPKKKKPELPPTVKFKELEEEDDFLSTTDE
jgi:hypothetical protein